MFRKMLPLVALLLLAGPVSAQIQPLHGSLSAANTLSITTGGSWQLLFSKTNTRNDLFVENYCTTTSQNIGTAESLFVWFGNGTPSGNPWANGSVELAACGSQTFDASFVVSQSVWVYAATTGHAFAAWVQQ
jgi:hypothetical protein